MAEFTFIERKPMDGRELQLDADATIGREGCDVVLPDPEVSRRHAALRFTGSGVAVEDLGSSNGTFVNGERVSGTRALSDGDVVRFGNTEWELRGTANGGAGVGSPQVTAARAVPAPPAEPATAQQAAPAAAAPAAAAPAAAAAPVGPNAAAEAASPGTPGEGRRGDVPQPLEVTPSAIHRTIGQAEAAAPPAFSPVGTKQTRGSAATRAGYTAFCFALFVATLIGVIVYFIVNGS
jgi:predicted component of type VI protein secretion system